MITKPIEWTKEKILKEIEQLYNEAEADEGILLRGELIRNKDFSENTYTYWKLEHREDKEIVSAMGKFEGLLRDRCLKGAINNKYNAVMSKFHLSCNHGMVERVHNEVNHTGRVELEGLFNNISLEEEEEE